MPQVNPESSVNSNSTWPDTSRQQAASSSTIAQAAKTLCNEELVQAAPYIQLITPILMESIKPANKLTLPFMKKSIDPTIQRKCCELAARVLGIALLRIDPSRELHPFTTARNEANNIMVELEDFEKLQTPEYKTLALKYLSDERVNLYSILETVAQNRAVNPEIQPPSIRTSGPDVSNRIVRNYENQTQEKLYFQVDNKNNIEIPRDFVEYYCNNDNEKALSYARRASSKLDREVFESVLKWQETNLNWGYYKTTFPLKENIIGNVKSNTRNPILINCDNFTEQLVKSKLENLSRYAVSITTKQGAVLSFADAQLFTRNEGSESYRQSVIKEVAEIENLVWNKVNEWRISEFRSGINPLDSSRVKVGRDFIKTQIQEEQPYAALLPKVLDHMLTEAFNSYERFPISYRPDPISPGALKYSGAHFKANKKSDNPIAAASIVLSERGDTFLLLNTLTEGQSNLLRERHGIIVTGKALINMDGDKIRLAYHPRSQNFVAVIKPETEQSARRQIDILGELNKIETSNDPGMKDLGFTELLDYAHVDIKQTIRGREITIPKSYIFMPLQAQTNGKEVLKTIANTTSRPKKILTFTIMANYARLVARLHKSGYFHRNINPGNFLFSKKNNNEVSDEVPFKIMLSGFKFAVHQDENFKDPNFRLPREVRFWPPELANAASSMSGFPEGYSPRKHDSFSLGLSMLQVYFGLNYDELVKASPVILPIKDKFGNIIPLNIKFDYSGAFNGFNSADLANIDYNTPENITAGLLLSDPASRISARSAARNMLEFLRNQESRF